MSTLPVIPTSTKDLLIAQLKTLRQLQTRQYIDLPQMELESISAELTQAALDLETVREHLAKLSISLLNRRCNHEQRANRISPGQPQPVRRSEHGQTPTSVTDQSAGGSHSSTTDPRRHVRLTSQVLGALIPRAR